MHNLQELMNPGDSNGMQSRLAALAAEEEQENPVDNTERVIIVCNSLPLKMKHDPEVGGRPRVRNSHNARATLTEQTRTHPSQRLNPSKRHPITSPVEMK